MIDGLIVLCGHTARSRSYVQAMQHYGLEPELVILYGEPSNKPIQTDRTLMLESDSELFCPDLSISLEESLASAGWNIHVCNAHDLHAPELLEVFRRVAPKLTVYSGYGGQLVPGKLIEAAGKMLHVHTGWLPEYRGSTTIYYSLLNENRCAASAILLDATIDTGPVVARKHYDAPRPGTDIDYLYDTALRADLLVDVLKKYSTTGTIGEVEEQGGEELPYYVIHPLLKHIAILSVDEA